MADVKIPVFDGQEYGSWKKRIVMYLKMKKCDLVVTRAKASTDKEDWDNNDLQAINYIYSAISNKQMELISDCETAYDIIRKLDRTYLKQSTALQIICRNKLENMRLKNFSNSTEFFNEFEKSVNELKAAGANVTEKEKLNYMLRTLPESLSHIGDLIDVLKEDEQTTDYVKNKIKMAEMNVSDTSSNTQSNAFRCEKRTMSAQEKTCYNCGKTGHFKYNCPEHTKSRKDSWRGGSRGGGSHNYQSRGTGRGYGRGGRGGGSYWQRGRGEHHDSGSGDHQKSGNSFLTQVEVMSAVQENIVKENNRINWLLDSGCTDHIINDEKYYSDSINLKIPVNVKIGDGTMLKATKVGRVISKFQAFNKRVEIKMKNVFFVEEMDRNLISYAKITDNNKIVSKGNTAKIYNSYNEMIAIAWKEGSLYKMYSYIDEKKESNMSTRNNVKCMTTKEKWHRILGHVNFSYLNTMCKSNMLEGLPEVIESDYLKCATCIENKMHNVPFENNRTKAKYILEIVHTDLNGPHATTGFNGEKYFLTFIDDFSKLAKVYAIKSKGEVYDCFVDYINLVENLTDLKVKKLRCDNGTEYLNSAIYKFVKEKGIVINTCPPYTHELNGTAERYNRSIMDVSRCLLAEARVNNCFWPEVVCAAAYLKNRTIANTIEKNKTPYEIFFNQKPSTKFLKMYGSRVFVRVPEQKRKSKWDRKADLGILLGYCDVGYRVLINNKITVTRHVDIIEEDVECIGLSSQDIGDNLQVEKNIKQNDEEFDENNVDEIKDSNESSNKIDIVNRSELRKSNRTIKRPDRFDDNYVYNGCIYVNFCNVNSPENFDEAMKCDESKYWKKAMDREISCLQKNKTWKLVEKQENVVALDLKWVYTKKSEDNYKARLVVRGFQQKEVLEDIYSPVAKMQTLKILLSHCCQNSLFVQQMDVETAFLNGKVYSEVYVKQPQGYEDGSDKVCKLDKSLYGLRESPRAWYECFDKYLRNLNFERSEYDYCLYSLKDGDEVVYLILFVDDLLICCKNKERLEYIKDLLAKRFQMKDLGDVKTYLGIEINYNQNKGIMTLDQKNYIESLAEKYQITQAKLYETPMEQNLKLENAKHVCEEIKFRSLIGALLYISSGTRLDISFSVNYLSRFQNCYDETHYKYAMRILKYLYLTKDLKLIYSKGENMKIMDCFVDADWAGDINDRRSTTGYIIRLYGNVVYWKSRKQGSVTKSSTAAEYVALSEAVSEIKLIKDVLNTFNVKINEPIEIYEDNSGAVNIAKYGNLTKNSKYIEMHYHFVNESYVDGIIDIIKVNSDNNVADILTKSLGKNKFVKFRNELDIKGPVLKM